MRFQGLSFAEIEMSSGAEMAQPLAMAVTMALVPFTRKKIPVAPSRSPKLQTATLIYQRTGAPQTGHLPHDTLGPKLGSIIQMGTPCNRLRSAVCAVRIGMAKSVKFELVAAPFSVELSGAAAREVRFVMTPD